jgi:hypothetical protein
MSNWWNSCWLDLYGMRGREGEGDDEARFFNLAMWRIIDVAQQEEAKRSEKKGI